MHRLKQAFAKFSAMLSFWMLLGIHTLCSKCVSDIFKYILANILEVSKVRVTAEILVGPVLLFRRDIVLYI